MEHLSKLRIDRKMTQLQVANYLGVSRTTYVKYETGNIQLPLQNAVKLAELFNVSLEVLIGVPSQDPVQPAADEKRSRLISMFDSLSDSNQIAVLQYMRFLASDKGD